LNPADLFMDRTLLSPWVLYLVTRYPANIIEDPANILILFKIHSLDREFWACWQWRGFPSPCVTRLLQVWDEYWKLMTRWAGMLDAIMWAVESIPLVSTPEALTKVVP